MAKRKSLVTVDGETVDDLDEVLLHVQIMAVKDAKYPAAALLSVVMPDGTQVYGRALLYTDYGDEEHGLRPAHASVPASPPERAKKKSDGKLAGLFHA